LPENQGKLIERAKRVGELTGRANAFAQASGNSGNLGSTKSGATKQVVSMTKNQKTKYDELKARNPKLAERFAESVRDMQE